MGNIGPFQLLIVLLIVVLIFGGKRLRSLGSDLGESIKGFKEAMKNKDENTVNHQTIEAEKITQSSQSKNSSNE